MIEDRLKDVLAEGVAAVAPARGLEPPFPEPELQRPRQKEFGDFTTNLAMVVASRAGADPRATAAAIVDALPAAPFLEKAEVAGPGFINLWTTDEWLHDVLRQIARDGDRYGAGGRPAGGSRWSSCPRTRRARSRSATRGTPRSATRSPGCWRSPATRSSASTTSTMPAARWTDSGRPSRPGTCSSWAATGRCPRTATTATTSTELARDIMDTEGPGLADLPPEERLVRLREEGARRAMEQIRATLERFGVSFDSYFLEASLVEKGEIAQAIERLARGRVRLRRRGRHWFRSTGVRRRQGSRRWSGRTGRTRTSAPTSPTSLDKFSRGFDQLVYVWGADHHGDIARVKGAATALGFDPDAGRDRDVPVRRRSCAAASP